MNHQYQLGLLCLTHLLISADGTVDQCEVDAMSLIRHSESISDDTFRQFEELIHGRKDRDVFQLSIELINQCTAEEKLRAFVLLYKLSEVDGRVHVKEIKLLLYSLQRAEIDFDLVVNKAIQTPSLL